MAARGQMLGFAGGALAMLLALSACATGSAAAEPPSASTRTASAPVDVAQVLDMPGPSVVDTRGAPLRPEYAEVVRQVHRALVAGDVEALHRQYAGDDWSGQAARLADPAVRRSVLQALCAAPANLGEGYVYSSPQYQTAFFLDYDPPRVANGPLRWRGIAATGEQPGATSTVGTLGG